MQDTKCLKKKPIIQQNYNFHVHFIIYNNAKKTVSSPVNQQESWAKFTSIKKNYIEHT